MLTDERIEEIFKGIGHFVEPMDFIVAFARAIEKAVKEEVCVAVLLHEGFLSE